MKMIDTREFVKEELAKEIVIIKKGFNRYLDYRLACFDKNRDPILDVNYFTDKEREKRDLLEERSSTYIK